MYELVYTARMKKDVRLMKKRGKDLQKLIDVLEILMSGKELPQNNKDHQLKGIWKEFRECHITPDWLFIYKIDTNEHILYATATGSHADLFEM